MLLCFKKFECDDRLVLLHYKSVTNNNLLSVFYRKDHIEHEKVSLQNWERNWKFTATNYRDVCNMLFIKTVGSNVAGPVFIISTLSIAELMLQKNCKCPIVLNVYIVDRSVCLPSRGAPYCALIHACMQSAFSRAGHFHPYGEVLLLLLLVLYLFAYVGSWYYAVLAII